MKKLDKNIISEYTDNYQGQKVTVKVLKPKDRKVKQNARRGVTNCPNCLSSVKVSDLGIWECTGDRIKIWEKQFQEFHGSDKAKQAKFLENLTSDNRFLELYDRWAYAHTNDKPEEFNCGYTNKIFLPISAIKTTMPDPVVTKQVERKLGRKLKVEEILGEEELWYYKSRIYTQYRKGAKKVRIPIINFPEDV